MKCGVSTIITDNNTMKMKYITLCLFTFLLTGNLLKAQTSVYVCSTNGAYGYCYGNNSVSNCAYNKCIEHGGKSPYSVLSTSTKGFGAIAVGRKSDGGQAVGAAAGYKSLADAESRAKQECMNQGGDNVYIADSFSDK